MSLCIASCHHFSALFRVSLQNMLSRSWGNYLDLATKNVQRSNSLFSTWRQTKSDWMQTVGGWRLLIRRGLSGFPLQLKQYNLLKRARGIGVGGTSQNFWWVYAAKNHYHCFKAKNVSELVAARSSGFQFYIFQASGFDNMWSNLHFVKSNLEFSLLLFFLSFYVCNIYLSFTQSAVPL